eukprot:359749-Chlamydomonas_euryale.AAC.8
MCIPGGGCKGRARGGKAFAAVRVRACVHACKVLGMLGRGVEEGRKDHDCVLEPLVEARTDVLNSPGWRAPYSLPL